MYAPVNVASICATARRRPSRQAGARSAQETKLEDQWPQFVAQSLVSRLERAEMDRRGVAAGVALGQRVADLVPAHVGAVWAK